MKFETNIKKLKAAYAMSKAAKVGDTCKCPACGSEFVKTNYQQAFCKSFEGRTVCKDHYWNNVTPNKRNNKTRISPANEAWMLNTYDDYDPGDSEYWDNKEY